MSLWSEMSLKTAARTDICSFKVLGSNFIFYERALGTKGLENDRDHSWSWREQSRAFLQKCFSTKLAPREIIKTTRHQETSMYSVIPRSLTSAPPHDTRRTVYLGIQRLSESWKSWERPRATANSRWVPFTDLPASQLVRLAPISTEKSRHHHQQINWVG